MTRKLLFSFFTLLSIYAFAGTNPLQKSEQEKAAALLLAYSPPPTIDSHNTRYPLLFVEKKLRRGESMLTAGGVFTGIGGLMVVTGTMTAAIGSAFSKKATNTGLYILAAGGGIMLFSSPLLAIGIQEEDRWDDVRKSLMLGATLSQNGVGLNLTF